MSADNQRSLEEASRRRAEIAADLALRIKERDQIKEEMEILARIRKRRIVSQGDPTAKKAGFLRRLWEWLTASWTSYSLPMDNGPAVSQTGQPQDGGRNGAREAPGAVQGGVALGNENDGVAQEVDHGGKDEVDIALLSQKLECLEKQIAALQKELEVVDQFLHEMGESLDQSLDTRRGRFNLQEEIIVTDPRGLTYEGQVVGMAQDRRPIVSLKGMGDPMSVEDGWGIKKGGIERSVGIDSDEIGGEDEGTKPTL